MKTNKKYWLVLLLPITAIVIIAVFLIPGKKHHDWDDDEEEEEAVGIPIDEEHFPDDAFRAFLLEQEFGEDAILSEEEQKETNRLRINNKDIHSLQGIEYFTHLTVLQASGNPLGQLVMPRMEWLYTLDCQACQLTKLDVSQCPNIGVLRCFLNQLTTLDLSGKPSLRELEARDNLLAELTFKGTDSLNIIDVRNNRLIALDLSTQRNLNEVGIAGNPMDEAQTDRFISLLPKGVYEETGFDEHIEAIPPHVFVEEHTLTPAQEQMLEEKGWSHWTSSNE